MDRPTAVKQEPSEYAEGGEQATSSATEEARANGDTEQWAEKVMEDGIWWILFPGIVGWALGMWCVYQALAWCLFSHSLPVSNINGFLLSRDVFWQWRELLQTIAALGIAFACLRYLTAMALRHYFEPSPALYRYVWSRQAAARSQA